ncbi:MAG: hypothetical protein RBU27_14670, partial [Bacteroidota bacterium]|nr:hypothetical protein [Bacteroidota bacterium]
MNTRMAWPFRKKYDGLETAGKVDGAVVRCKKKSEMGFYGSTWMNRDCNPEQMSAYIKSFAPQPCSIIVLNTAVTPMKAIVYEQYGPP